MSVTRVERPEVPDNFHSPRGLLVCLLAGAAVIGGLVAYSIEIALGAGLVMSLVLLFVRSDYKPEIIVASYWATLILYETIAHGLEVQGFFYPFYLAFLIGLVASVLGSGVRVRPVFFWPLFGFLAIVAASFVGFMQPIDISVVQRVLAYLLGALVYLQFRSTAGLRVVMSTAIVTSLAVATWVIISASRGGFAYRGDVGVNQNLVAFDVGLGLVAAVAVSVQALGTSRQRIGGVSLLLLSGALVYAMLLLASRGMIIAISLVLGGMLFRLALLDRARLLALLVLLAVGASGLLLPGGGEILERFTDENVETGNERTPIWTALYNDYRDGNFADLLLGKGFDSSKLVVQRGFGTLTSAHNAYLQILYEFGLLGLGFFLALHLAATVASWQVPGALGLTMFGLTLFLLGANLTSTAPDGFVYWAVLAFVFAIGTWGGQRRTRLGRP